MPRVILLAILFSSVFTVFIARLVQLQLLRGEDYASEVYEARFRVDVLPARRGRILDRTGQVIADNRTVFNASVVLQDLAQKGRIRRSTPIWRFQGEELNLFAGAIAHELNRPLAAIRGIIIDELMQSPGVALRRGPREEEFQAGLFVLPRGGLLATDEAGNSAVEAGWETLAQSGILQLDPYEAVLDEYQQRLGENVRLLDDIRWSRFIQYLSTKYQTQPEYISRILLPFAPEVRLKDFPQADNPLRWRALTSSRQEQAQAALGRLVGEPVSRMRDSFEQFFIVQVETFSNSPYLFVPSARFALLAQHLPEGTSAREIPIVGFVPQNEVVYLLQGERSQSSDPIFQQFISRLQANLDTPPRLGQAWLSALVQRHAERLTLRQVEREYRRHHLVFDGVAVAEFVNNLSGKLVNSQQPLLPLALEQRLTQARRLADRDWRGQTRHDPLLVVEDIAPNLAHTLAGQGLDIPRSISRGFEGTKPLIKGLRIQTDVGREYLYPGSASHLIGYLGKLSSVFTSETALTMGLDPEGWLGRSGIESEYDELLQGSNGRRSYLRTPTGNRQLESVEPTPGVDIHLTLDMELQRVAERSSYQWHELAQELKLTTEKMDASRKRVNHGRAAFVLMDVHDGAILAMASSPGYNLYDVRTRYAELNDPDLHPGQPLIDHSTAASHPPGSTLKPLVALIALSQGAIQPSTQVYSKGYMARTASGAKILREHSASLRGDFSIQRALQKSSNVAAAVWAERTGPEALTGWMHLFGLGARNGIDTTWQRPGLLPTPGNIDRLRPSEPTWFPSDTWRAGIGQFASSSPLQVAVVPATVANGGKIVRPYLWRDALQQDDLNPQDPNHLPLSPAAIQAVQEGMQLVTEAEGTATSLRFSGPLSHIKIAAKTGTAEWGSTETRDHAAALADPNRIWTPSHGWLIGYAPVDNPRVAFAAFVYGGTSGGRSCTGIAKAVLETYFTKYPQGH